MPGLYIHVPFCQKKCSYCDFVSYPYQPGPAVSYGAALREEMKMYAAMLSPDKRSMATVFVGGGTPTCLPGDSLAALVEASREYFPWRQGAEVTVEANPGTLDAEKLYALKQAGVNRLSIGVQACRDETLGVLGRIHGWEQAGEAVELAREAGFDNISLDLIFGVPGQSNAHWAHCLREVVSLGPEHISAYGLQLEEGTPLCRDVRAGKLQPCSEDEELQMFRHAVGYLKKSGYQHYEISNYARPGYQCRHNLVYWHNLPYLGLGPAAHSFLDGIRFANTPDVQNYINKIEGGILPIADREELTVRQEMSETVFLGLRLMEGFDVKSFARRFGCEPEQVYGQEIDKLISAGLIERTAGRLKLTLKGLPLANRVFMEFV